MINFKLKHISSISIMYALMKNSPQILNAARGAYKHKKRDSYSVEDSDGFLAVTIGAGQTFKLCQDVDDNTSQIR